jgi:ATP-dependent RNA helicase DDX19/DBP5
MSEEDKKPEEVVEAPVAPVVKEEEAPKTEEDPPAETDEVVAGELDDEVAEATIKARHEGDDSSDLTKRLQKLALERQKESRGERLKVIQADTGSHLFSAKTFQEMDLPKYLLDAIFAMGFDRPSAIQEEALPRILAEPPRNVIGQAQSGSGKTAAFCLGMLYRIEVDTPASTQALCVTPTRELAVQIFTKTVAPMAANMKGLKVQLALSGEQIERGKSMDAHMVIGTPGKVVDWLKRKIIKTRTIKVFVLDEADEMVGADGHRANSVTIKKQLPKNCQCLFFSATFPPEVVQFADKIVYNPDKILIEAGPDSLVRSVVYCLCYCFVLWKTSLSVLFHTSNSSCFFPHRTHYRFLISSSSSGSIPWITMEESSNSWLTFIPS